MAFSTLNLHYKWLFAAFRIFVFTGIGIILLINNNNKSRYVVNGLAKKGIKIFIDMLTQRVC